MTTCSCKNEMVLLSGRLKNARKDEGQVWACPKCDVSDRQDVKNIIQLSEENTHE